jgi:hypothetical protein
MNLICFTLLALLCEVLPSCCSTEVIEVKYVVAAAKNVIDTVIEQKYSILCIYDNLRHVWHILHESFPRHCLGVPFSKTDELG